MPKISPNGGKSLTPINVPILEEFIRGSPKRGRNFPQGEKELPPNGDGGRRSGLKRRRHILLRMEENKQVGVKCKKSLDVELFDTASSIVMHAARKEGYIGSSFANYIRRN